MIGIVSFLSPRYAQFIYKYTAILDEESIDYEVVFWNRELDNYSQNKNWIGYDKEVNTFQPFYKKIGSFISFSYFMYKTILKKKYDKLIILTTQTAIPLAPLLLSKYKEKYIYDYRDITYENFSLYKHIVNSLVKKSFFTAISSKGFVESQFLDESNKFVISHNTRNFKLMKIDKVRSKKTRITYWGMVRQPEFNKKVCDFFSKFKNIELTYHGAGYHKEIQKYCQLKEYRNIIFTGKYNLSDIEDFVQNTDFVLNAYENDKQQQPAMTVKFYDSVMYQLPMIVTKNSYMSKIVSDFNLGLNIDWNEKVDIEKEINNFDWEKYRESNKYVFNSINNDDRIFKDCVVKFCKDIKF